MKYKDEKISNLVTLFDSLHKTPKSYVSEGYPMLRVTDIDSGYVDISSTKNVDKKTFKEFTKRHTPQKGDIIFTRVGSYGKTVFVDKKVDFCLGQNTVCVNPDKSKVYPYYLYACFNSYLIIEQIEAMVGGASQPTISLRNINEIKVPLPRIETQQKIASILSAYDDLIDNNTRRIAILEEMARLIYREWFVFYRYPGHENDKMVDSGTELGEVPEVWRLKPLKGFGRIETGKTPRKKDPENYGDYMPFIKTPDMHDQFFVIETSDNLSEIGSKSQKKKTLPPNSICVSCIGTAGVVALTSVPSQTNQQINSIILENEADREYLYYAIKDLRPLMEKIGSTGATMTNVSKGKFQALEVLWPGDDLVQSYHEKVASMFDQIQILQKQNLKLKKTRDLLLPKLISGKIEISELVYAT